jgi:endonuclease YncB( thermonuclease family)
MRRILHPRDRVTLVRDLSQDNRDHYDRLLRYVEHGSADVNRKQVLRGWAHVYVFESPFKRVKSYRRAQRRAKQADRGACHCGGHF